MDEYQGTGQQPQQPLSPGQEGGPAYYRQPLPEPPPGRRMTPPPNRGRRGGPGWGKTVITAIVAGLIGALLILLVMPAVFGVNPYDLIRGKVRKAETKEEVSLPRQITKVVSPTQGAMDVSAIARKVTPSIVNIDVTGNTRVSPFQTIPGTGTGSGVIYTADGYIITNNHVVTGANSIMVTLASGEELKATKVGADPQNDIAVVKINKTGLPAVTIGDSDNLAVGELVVAIGSPLGFQQTVTAGIISALHRNVSGQDQKGGTFLLVGLVQTDAPINAGNSGGGLYDSAARIIGINTLIASETGGSVGIGFAIPINTAKKVADAIIAGEPISHPYIGIQVQSVTQDIASQYNLPVTDGAFIVQAVNESSAEKAGLKTGDIVVAVDGKPVKTADDLIAAIRKKNVGDTISLDYYEGDSKKNAKVQVTEEPTNTSGQ